MTDVSSRYYASLSFRYLPMAAESAASERQFDPPSPHDSFEFFSDVGREICFAEDVFFHGKFVPFGLPPLPPARAKSGELRRTQGSSSKSGELRRASRDSSPGPKAPPPTTGSAARPATWRMLALGGAAAGVPARMEMRDIRSRQRRRRAPADAATAGAAAKGSGEGKDVSWRILRSLSCNAVGSSALAVAPPACFAVRTVRAGLCA